ncbi:MAG: GLUG motif-containing protein, partial [Rikenellaceae bacterium]
GSGGVVKNLGVSGEVTGSSIIGGVVGENSGTVTNCYNTAEVSGTQSVCTSIGGVVGDNFGSGSSVTNCYNTAAVSGDYYVGGVVGSNNNGSITNCYWVDVADDNATAGLGYDTEDITEKTTKKTAAEMQAEDFAKLLNTNAKEITGACAWVDNSSTSGYPTLDFGVAAE